MFNVLYLPELHNTICISLENAWDYNSQESTLEDFLIKSFVCEKEPDLRGLQTINLLLENFLVNSRINI